MEYFGRAVVHAMAKLDAPRDEIRATRRLFVALGQAHLNERS